MIAAEISVVLMKSTKEGRDLTAFLSACGFEEYGLQEMAFSETAGRKEAVSVYRLRIKKEACRDASLSDLLADFQTTNMLSLY